MTLAPSVRKSPIRPAAVLLGLFVVCYGVAALGASITAPSLSTWYATLAKPGFTPPDWLFAPIWTALYGLMAIAAWLVWRTPKHGPEAESRRSGLILFAVQLSLNASGHSSSSNSTRFCPHSSSFFVSGSPSSSLR